MAGFTLDEVRETYSTDMSNFVSSISEAASALLSAQALSLGVPRAANGNSLFEALANHGHAIYGSSSLIDLQSMMQVSLALEDMASRGHEALILLEAQVAQVRSLAALSHDAADALKVMLELELEGKGSDARAVAAALLPRIEAAVSTLPPAPSPEDSAAESSGHLPLTPTREFAFEDDLVPEAEPANMNAELREVFQGEVREFVGPLQQHLRTFALRPDDAVIAGRVERIYHTIKGAAATVGLVEVTEIAAGLQARFEEVLDGRARVSPPLLNEVFRLTNRMLRAVELPEISLEVRRREAQTAEGDRARVYFLEEARHIAAQSSALIEALASAGQDRRGSLITQLERLFHGLKGSALVLGDQSVADLAVMLHEHAQSAAVDQLRTGLKHLLALIEGGDEPFSVSSSSSSLNAPAVAAARPVRRPETIVPVEEKELWESFLQECQELLASIDKEVFALETSPQPRINIQSLFRDVHTLKGAVSSVGLAPTAKVLHLVEDLLEKLADQQVLPSMKDVATLLLAVQEEVRLNLRQSPSGTIESSHETIEAWAAQVLKGGIEAPSSRSAASSTSTRSSSTDVPSEVDGDLGERQYLRVNTDRLDELMNLAGELVVNRSRLVSRVGKLKWLQRQLGDTRRTLYSRIDDFRRQYEFANIGGGRKVNKPAPVSRRTSAQVGDFTELELDRYEDVHILARSVAEVADDLTEMDGQISHELNQIHEDSDTFSFVVSRIQSEVTRTRMVSIDALFSRLRLPVRDAAMQQSKSVEVLVTQNEVAIDKTLVDALYKPMLHLVRNAVYHGIEASEARTRAGKPATGRLELRARQDAGQIVIEVCDDGRGLDLAALKEQGVRAGLVAPTVALDDPSVKNLVFAPRLSTSESVNEVAGRGVGGDVVKRAVERLNGDIRVESVPGRGAVFSITLPMTLLITPALLFRSGAVTYAVPLFFAERIVEIEDRAMVDVMGASQLRLGDKFVPVRRLEQIFGEPTAPRVGPVIVLRIGDRRLALQVDSLLIREEVVVKNMGQLLHGHPLFSGVTVRGDGALVLILDVSGLIENEHYHERVVPQRSLPERSASVRAETKAAEPQLASAPRTAPAKTVNAPLKRVLFVDDSLSVRKVAERALQQLGVDVTLAVDGRDALDKLRLSSFDLVFTDLEMPRLHGFELIREVRLQPNLRELPVVVISSRSGTKHQEQARGLGATDYLTKPFTPQTLEAVLARLLGWKREG